MDILGLIKVLAPAAIVGAISFFMLKQFIGNEIRKEHFLLKKSAMKDIIPLRFQSYERAVVFLDRLRLENLSARIPPKKGQDAFSYKVLLIQIIKQEYDHNISQQIYMSPESWKMLETAKIYVSSQIQKMYKDLGEKSSSFELYEQILKGAISEKKDAVVQEAIDFIKKDVRSIF